MKKPDKYFLAGVAIVLVSIISITAMFFQSIAVVTFIFAVPAIIYGISNHSKN